MSRKTAPLVAELEEWLRGERARLSRHTPVAQAIDYMLKRGAGFTRFLNDGRICLTNNAAEECYAAWLSAEGPGSLPGRTVAPIARTSCIP